MKKLLLPIIVLFQIFFISLHEDVFFKPEINKPTKLFVNSLNRETISLIQESPESLSDLQNANVEQLNYWANNLSRFDGRDFGYITKEKNQGSLGICWAYAAIGAVEANILRDGIDPSVDKDKLDLDEIEAAYVRFNRDGENDPLYLTTNDTYSLSNWRNNGGHADDAFMAMSQGYSPIKQTNYSSTSDLYIKNKITQSDYFVEGFKQIEKSQDAIKRAILKYGSVTMEYKAPQTTSQQFLYHSDGTSLGHASLIVGWDDTISKDKFWPNQPSSNGAWIVKNSWGPGGNKVDDRYCFYLAYDSYLSNNLYVVDIGLRDQYQNIYYYDGQVTDNETKYITDAHGAIYEAKLSSTTMQEQLKAVQFGVRNKQLTADIKVYKLPYANPGNVNDSRNIPDSGTLVAHKKDVYFEDDGFYTITFDEPINLEQGEYFSLVISGKDSSGNPLFPFYAAETKESVNDMTYRKYNDVWTSLKGNSGTYADYSAGMSVRLRAITNIVPRVSILDNDLKNARIELSSRFMYYEKGKPQIPDINVYFGDERLQKDQDYTVAFIDNVTPGQATVEIQGINNYFGTRTTTFEVAKPKTPPGALSGTIDVYNVTNLNQVPAPINWEWIDKNVTLNMGISDFSYSLRYIGDDAEYYQNKTCSVKVNRLNQAPPANINLSNAMVEIVGEYTFNGKAITPNIKVIYQGNELHSGIDYSVTFQNNTNAGTALIIIKGNWKYTGEITQTFQIKQADYPFNRPNNIIKVKGNITFLSEISLGSEDWTWKEPNKVLNGEETVAIAIYNGADKANYQNTEMEITIVQERPKDLASIDVELVEPVSFVYDGYEKRPEVIVKDGNKTLEKDIDYEVEYQNNVSAGTASVIVNGINDYSGSKTLTFTIKKAERLNFKVSQENWTFNAAVIPTPMVSGVEETAKITYLYATAEDGTYSDKRPTEAGTYWIKAIIEESSNYKSAEAKTSFTIYKEDYPLLMPPSTITVSRDITTLQSVPLISGWKWEEPDTIIDRETITAYAIYEDQTNYEHYRVAITIKREAPKDISTLEIQLEDTCFVYDGNFKTPRVIVKDGNKILKIGVDYEIKYQNNVSAGEGEVIVIGKNDYQGTREIKFTIMKAEKPNVGTTIYIDEKATRLSDIELPEGFVWENEDLEITSGKMIAKAIYKGEDANNYETIEIYFEIISESFETSDTGNIIWLMLSIFVLGIAIVGIGFVIFKLR